ncbi:hypothetical protein DL768_010443 [Monosporascus sp. mg162]|nr:hypothetical protein DL768_010443 [Monosporascus sp. mg162]
MERLISATLNDVARLCEAGFYDYIVVGSGIGGGILARTLVESSPTPRVLLIDRGGLLFDTHCTNVPSPRWNQTSLDAPSMDNAMVYDVVKSPIFTVTSKSAPYAGGPVYGLGGRSTLWGLYTPKIDEDQVKRYFPEKVYEYLYKDGYDKAYRLMTNDDDASTAVPYPANCVSASVKSVISDIISLLNNLPPPADTPYKCSDFQLCPMAAEFTARDASSRMYQMVMGGYSTVSWILERIFNKSEYLNVLSETQVMTVNRAKSSDGKPEKVESLTVLDQRGRERVLPTGKATVILSAGTIDTAAIALRSGLGGNNLVGQGLTDHDIWGTRFVILGGETLKRFGKRALRLQSWVTLRSKDGLKTTDRCLLNITINATSFLGQAKDRRFSAQYINENNKILPEEDFLEAELKLENQYGRSPPPRGSFRVTIQVVYCFCAPLRDDNKVLGLPEPVPTIQVNKDDTSAFAQSMRILAQDIKTALSTKKQEMREIPETPETPEMPEVTKAPFGVVAHEVGTMRMGRDETDSVVDENLQVHGWENLFACDLSVFPVSPSANPSLTLAALSQRLGEYLEVSRGTSGRNEA